MQSTPTGYLAHGVKEEEEDIEAPMLKQFSVAKI